jgi:hypothetical protein
LTKTGVAGTASAAALVVLGLDDAGFGDAMCDGIVNAIKSEALLDDG